MLKCLIQNLTHSKYPRDLTVFVNVQYNCCCVQEPKSRQGEKDCIQDDRERNGMKVTL